MPIYGLTDSAPSFKEIGRIRKGAPKGTGNIADLNYFRQDFRPGEEAAAQAFAAAFGKQPTKFTGRLAFDSIPLSWDANWEVYNTRGLLGRSDGIRWTFLRSNADERVLVRDGVIIDESANLATSTDPETGEIYPVFDPRLPVYSYKNRKGQDVAVYPRPTGKLKLIIPQVVQAAGLCYTTLITHAVYDCKFISQELAAIEKYAAQLGLPISRLTLVVSRRMDKVPATIDGKPTMIDKSLVHVDLDPAIAALLDESWTKSTFRLAAGQAPLDLPALPVEILDGEEPEDENESDPAPIPAAAPAPAVQNAGPRQSVETGAFTNGSAQTVAGLPLPEGFTQPLTITPAAANQASFIQPPDNVTDQPPLEYAQPVAVAASYRTASEKESAGQVTDVANMQNIDILGGLLWPGKWPGAPKDALLKNFTVNGATNLQGIYGWLKARRQTINTDAGLFDHVKKSWAWAKQEYINDVQAMTATWSPIDYLAGLAAVERGGKQGADGQMIVNIILTEFTAPF